MFSYSFQQFNSLPEIMQGNLCMGDLIPAGMILYTALRIFAMTAGKIRLEIITVMLKIFGYLIKVDPDLLCVMAIFQHEVFQ